MAEIYDFIIVGAGSAGCVLANRLSADPSVKDFPGEMPKGIGKLVMTQPFHTKCAN